MWRILMLGVVLSLGKDNWYETCPDGMVNFVDTYDNNSGSLEIVAVHGVGPFPTSCHIMCEIQWTIIVLHSLI